MNSLAIRLFDALENAELPADPPLCHSAVMRDAGSQCALRFFAYADTSGKLSMLRFRATACPHLLAACELTCRKFAASPADWPEAKDLMRELDVPIQKTGRILLIEDALNNLREKLNLTQSVNKETK